MRQAAVDRFLADAAEPLAIGRVLANTTLGAFMRHGHLPNLGTGGPNLFAAVNHVGWRQNPVMTATDEQISKLPLNGKSLNEFSLETVKMFYNDAQKAGFKL